MYESRWGKGSQGAKPKQGRGVSSARTEPSTSGERQHALEATDVEGTIVLEEAQVDELVVDREPVDRTGVCVSRLGGCGEAVEDL